MLESCFFYKGVKQYIDAFRTGFNSVFDLNLMKSFKSSEIEDILCSVENDANWDLNVLSENIIPNHGYDRTSNQYKFLLLMMKEMNFEEKKRFLHFTTGCSRLPIGGMCFNRRIQKP